MLKPPSNPDLMKLPELKIFNSVGRFFKEIIISDDSIIQEYILSSEKHLWVLADDTDDLFSRFSEYPMKDIVELYKSKYDIDVSDYPVHFIYFNNITVAQKFILELTRLPVIFESYKDSSHNPIFLDFIDI